MRRAAATMWATNCHFAIVSFANPLALEGESLEARCFPTTRWTA